MPDGNAFAALIDLLDALGRASAWVILIVILGGFAWGFVRGWWVPGWVHLREVRRGNRAEDAVAASTRTTEQAAAATRAATDAVLSVQRLLEEQRRRESG